LLQVVLGVWVQGDLDGILDLRLHDNAKVEVQAERSSFNVCPSQMSNE
jgi:hypothetical protein